METAALSVLAISGFLLWLTPWVERLEIWWRRRPFLEPKFQGRLRRWERKLGDWLRRSQVKLTARQFLLFLFFAAVLLPLMIWGGMHSLTFGVVVGWSMAVYMAMYPWQKRRRFEDDLRFGLRRVKMLMASLYERGITPEDMLPLLISATDGALRQLLERAYQRMQTTDTLADALTWMAQETGLAEMRQLASVWIQAGRYEGTSLETQLKQMAVDERAQFLFNLEKRAERKRMSVLFEVIAFIALPTIFLVGILILMRAWAAFEHMSGF